MSEVALYTCSMCVVCHHSSTSSSKDASIASKSSAACSHVWPSCVSSNVRPSFLPVPTVAHPRKSGLNRTHTSPFNPGSMVTQDSRLTPVFKKSPLYVSDYCGRASPTA